VRMMALTRSCTILATTICLCVPFMNIASRVTRSRTQVPRPVRPTRLAWPVATAIVYRYFGKGKLRGRRILPPDEPGPELVHGL
jgi:hypothetical protein